MFRMPDNNRQTNQMSRIGNRRQFLKYAGLASATFALPTTGIGAASSGRGSPAQIAEAYSDVSEGLTEAQIRKTAQDAVNRFRSAGGVSKPIVISTFDIPENATATSFVFYVGEGGKTDYFLGLAQTTADAKDVREKAKMRKKEYRELARRKDNSMPTRTRTQMGSSEVSIQQAVDEEWTRVTGGTMDYPYDPEGEVVSDADVWEYATANEPRFIARTDLTGYPGVIQYNSGWYTDDYYLLHNWEDYEASSVDMVDHRPDRDYTGDVTTTFTLAYDSAGVSWTYDSPDIYQYDASNNPTGKWHWEWRPFGTSKGGSGSPVLSTGSEVVANSAPSYGDLLLFIDSSCAWYCDDSSSPDWDETHRRGVLHSLEYE